MSDISSGYGATQVATPSTTPSATAQRAWSGSNLGKQDFLKLLIAQLRNQDPLKPAEDREVISQMAQFSALEATQSLSSAVERSANLQLVSQAGALVGKWVEAARPDAGEGATVAGTVTGVTFQSQDGIVSATLRVAGEEVDLANLRGISTPPNGTP